MKEIRYWDITCVEHGDKPDTYRLIVWDESKEIHDAMEFEYLHRAHSFKKKYISNMSDKYDMIHTYISYYF